MISVNTLITVNTFLLPISYFLKFSITLASSLIKNIKCHSFPLAHVHDLTWGLPGAEMLGVYQGIFFLPAVSFWGVCQFASYTEK